MHPVPKWYHGGRVRRGGFESGVRFVAGYGPPVARGGELTWKPLPDASTAVAGPADGERRAPLTAGRQEPTGSWLSLK